MAIYFFVSVSSDFHLFSENIDEIKALGIEAEVNYLSDFPQVESRLNSNDVLVSRNFGGLSFQGEMLMRINSIAKKNRIPFLCLPGFKNDDPSVLSLSTGPLDVCNQLISYYESFSSQNLKESLKYLSDLYLGTSLGWIEPEAYPEFGTLPNYRDILANLKSENSKKKVIAILFYRSHFLANDFEPIQSAINAIEKSGSIALPIFCSMMKQPNDDDIHPIRQLLKGNHKENIADVIIDCLSYATVDVSTTGNVSRVNEDGLFSRLNCPVLHALYSSESHTNWLDNPKGMNPRDMAMKVVMPEFDGKIIAHPIGFVEEVLKNGKTVPLYKGDPERIDRLVSLANNYAELAFKKNKDKKVAIILTNYPTQNARIGNAVGLDTPASLIQVLRELKDSGYDIDEIPESGDALIHSLIDQVTYDTEFLTETQIELAPAQVESKDYQIWHESFPEKNQAEMAKDWGQPPGNVYTHKGKFYLPGIFFKNVFVGIQPPRGFGENPVAIYHSPEIVPTHHYLAFYRWLNEGFKADAVIHMGKHGNLEWLPGKSVALAETCYPDLAIYDLPFFYYFIINNPGEGSQAKRRTHSVLVDHMVPPMTRADLYDDLARIEQLIEEWTYIQSVDPDKLEIVQNQIWELCDSNHINHDLGFEKPPENFKEYRKAINGFLCEIGNTQIREGLHILGKVPEGDQLINMFVSLARIDTPPYMGTQSCFMEFCGIHDTSYFINQAVELDCKIPETLLNFYGKSVESRGELLQMFDTLSFAILEHCHQHNIRDDIDERIKSLFGVHIPNLSSTINFILKDIYPKLKQVGDELTHLLDGLNGKFIEPGPSGAPTRGMATILPTGRNFYSVDIHSLPTTTSWIMGKKLAEGLLNRYEMESGSFPESVAMILWGTSNMRTKGDDIAQILYLLGVKPVWKPENKRVIGVEAIPLEELKRPRVDVCIRISGFFRDAFPNLVELMDKAINLVANLEEPVDMNFVRKHYLESKSENIFRIFGAAPGRYGTGILEAINSKNWETKQDLADIFVNWSGFAYTRDDYGIEKKEEFKQQLSQMDVVSQNQDNREHDIFDSDDYLQFHGGLINAVNQIKTGQGKGKVKEYFGDSSNPAAVKIKSLKEEVRQVYRARVVNPKWINAMKQHGYKGGLEMAATLDYMFGYDATTDVIDDHMYEGVSEKYLMDPDTQEFLREKNPWAIRAMGERLLEAANRGLWEKPDQDRLLEIESLVASVEGDIEKDL
ncbi:MAG: cobaltochelatase subunit CobN [Nitrospina sp.]|jgi:cobaltochelatase CobN|nr:cobaltochelatase subunit CobN [Nitrospina sp.]MBT3875165.1 cobaltochelatase subunit CobN [Nitrospina sp.]MBT4047405.1 cobaltochelatase subunit CobN [Nitrospina sp.]MBT4556028.1 cobaltochelatase subunit CobN [Nitrospina sp.]MBT5349845.1 cobaltochelatase subunit CobN [Nitrospina sp.]